MNILAYIYYGKVNINNDIYDVYDKPSKKDEMLRELFLKIGTEKSVQIDENIHIKFITINKDEDTLSITGRVVKIFKDDIKIYDRKRDDITDLPNDKLARSATFYFDVQHEIVAFTSGRFFGRKQFVEYFERLLNEHTKLDAYKVFVIMNKGQFKEKIKPISKVYNIKLKIIPKNPGANDIKQLYANPDALSEMKATTYVQEFRTNKSRGVGLNINNRFMGNAIDGAANGYGEMTIKGTDINKQEISISSVKDAPERRLIPDNEKTSILAIREWGERTVSLIITKMMSCLER